MVLSGKKTVLITGAGGFIGSNIAKEFQKDWKIFAIVNKSKPDIETEIIKGDLTNKDFIKELCANYKFDVVIHAAGLASDIGKDSDFKKINFAPVTFLPQIAKEKFIYISSTDVYGIKDFKNADESTPYLEYPKNPYPKYKILAEKYIKSHCKNYVIIRPAAVWGENDKTLENRFLGFLKVSPYIVHFGKWKGQNRWPLANVKSVAKTVYAASNTNKFDNRAINIMDKKFTTIDEYYRQLAQKYFPEKTYKTITLPMWVGKTIGLISTVLSNILGLKRPLFDPTFYAVHHISSNLDFSGENMEC